MKLGLIAGNGRFPFLVLDAARAHGPRRHDRRDQGRGVQGARAAAARPAPPASMHWISLGQLGGCIKMLKQAGVTPGGDGRPGQAHQDLRRHRARPDALSVLTQLKSRNTDALIAAVADVMRDHGIELIDSTSLLTPLLASAGVLTERAPTEDEQKDLDVRLPHGRRHRRPRHRADDRRQAPGRRRRRGDGGHRRDDRARRTPGGPGRVASSRSPSRSRTCGSTCRSSACHDPGDAGRRRHGAVARCRQDADVRRRGDAGVGRTKPASPSSGASRHREAQA